MPGVGGDDAQLEEGLRELVTAWTATEEGWRDQARAAFAQECLDEIESRARAGMRAIRQLDALMKEAQSQCR